MVGRKSTRQKAIKIIEELEEEFAQEKRYKFLDKFNEPKQIITIANALKIEVNRIPIRIKKDLIYRRKILTQISQHKVKIQDYWRILIND